MLGVPAGQAIAIAMPMTVEAVVAYFGIILAGCAAVSIADSFAAAEMASRLRIANAAAIVTQVLQHVHVALPTCTCFTCSLVLHTILHGCSC